MKRNTMIFALILLITLIGLMGCGKDRQTLYIFNWSDYIDPTLISEFEEANNCKVKYSTFDSNENMLTKVKSSIQSFDILFPSGDHVSILNELGLLEELDITKITNFKNLNTKLLAKARSFDPENKLSIPYAWGLTGLMYNKQFVPSEIVASAGWNILGDSFFDGKNKITMLDDAREVIGAALIYSGYSVNDTSPEALEAAHEVLKIWDRNITQFDSDSYKNELQDGTTWLAQAYNGDALQQMAENPDLAFILPKEGAAMWMDNMVMLKNAQNKELAYKFIDFMLDPEISKRNSEYIMYPTPNIAAMQMMDADFINNKIINPDDEYLDKCYMIDFLDEAVRSIDQIYEDIKMN
ncbi:MAG: spermidine/putrescine ABC transporter substrate-binding protein [Candidatus Cloacimonadaceae bacterium]|nr:spermidine/putrescine ABC transporter substrate-binding protein [Candidatus Cloacimonadota bacterium]MDY0128167.1 spermidine/putrescine ABC transporter substrate-binding protein [Candidatus Cloacimonadaceae bacterium]MCB5254782.1 spermidine/putrescine ABC transporter substrate-binding protein [Candidatus Cloacimonadota bacterium]MCK9178481.1 spermidine/putrescine ABC transporter substrate-binding protein [Candidatus Cloacimonadota bacterium]MCK9243041.1 spermidine/putrescine ABC transporter 